MGSPEAASEYWIELELNASPDAFEVLVGELEYIGWESFLEEEQALHAYRNAAGWDDALQEQTEAVLKQQGYAKGWQWKQVAQQNWNADWEATIKPVSVPPFLIHPSWHTPSADQRTIPIIIDPKMSFGTGYHETTRIMLNLILRHGRAGQRVLDAGTGTGILAIACAKRYDARVLAFDSDEWVAENLQENLAKNECLSRVDFCIGTLEDISEDFFDLILANINRNVLERYLDGFAEKCAPGGLIMLSGLFVSDTARMDGKAKEVGFKRIDQATEGEWWGGVYAPAP